MKLLDIFAGYAATAGTHFLHFAYFAASGAFYFRIVNKGTAEQKWLDLIDSWFYAHLVFVLGHLLSKTVLSKMKELYFLLFFIAILNY
jgi:hypothetical protein